MDAIVYAITYAWLCVALWASYGQGSQSAPTESPEDRPQEVRCLQTGTDKAWS